MASGANALTSPQARGTGARVVGVLLLLFLPVSLLLFYACLHASMHNGGEDGFYFSGMMAPVGLTALWLTWFGIVLVLKATPGPHMKVPGAIALFALVSGLFMNIWRMGGYPEDRPLALLFLGPAFAIGLAGIGNFLDDGKSKSARPFYVLAPIVWIVWTGLVFLWKSAARD